jgi:hypothetical protein
MHAFDQAGGHSKNKFNVYPFLVRYKKYYIQAIKCVFKIFYLFTNNFIGLSYLILNILLIYFTVTVDFFIFLFWSFALRTHY